VATKPVVARLPDGREYGFESDKIALREHPDAKILRYQNGDIYEEPEKKPAKADDEKKA